jgi:DNA-binding MarR family transcriptional regulator
MEFCGSTGFLSIPATMRAAEMPSPRRGTGGLGRGVERASEGMTAETKPDQRSGRAAGAARPSLLYMVKQLELAVRARLDGILKDAGITALQYTALTVLDQHDGLSPARLARNSFVTPQSTAGLVANLERRNLVRRERNPANRRELVISLTASGRRLLTRLEQAMTSGLGQNEAEAFRSYLDSCRAALNRPGT